MTLDEILAALDDGGVQLSLEQRVRRGDPGLADMMVLHRAALERGGSAALLQRLGRASGPTWLEPLLPRPVLGQPLWGHRGPVRWLRVAVTPDGDRLVSRGEDGRLRRWTPAGRCVEDRAVTALDDARSRGGLLVELDGDAVLLRHPEGDRPPRRVPLPAWDDDDPRWRHEARLLDDGTVAVCVADDAWSLYGPEYSWRRLDPLDGSLAPMEPPGDGVTLGGLAAVALPDGTLRLVGAPDQLEPPTVHRGSVGGVALAPGLLVSGADDGVRFHDRAGIPAARGAERHQGLDQIVAGQRVVSTSRYLGDAPQPEARIWDPETGASQGHVRAGQRYQDFMSCDPTGARLAFTVDGELRLQELSGGPARPVPLTWHWTRRHAWSADGARLAVQHSATALAVWDLALGRRERILTTDILDSASCSLSEDGAAALVDHSFYRLRAFRVEDGAPLPGLEPGINMGASASCGELGVAGGVQGGYWFHLGENRRQELTPRGWVHACHAAGGVGALAGEGGAYAVDLASGALLWSWDHPEPEQVQVVVVGRAVVALDREGTLTTLVDGATSRRSRVHPGGGSALCALPDGTVLSGGEGGTLRRGDPLSGEELWRRPGQGAVRDLSAGGGKVLYAAGDSLRLEQLDTGEGQPLPAGVGQPRLTPDGRRLLSLDRVARLDVLDARAAAVLEARAFGAWEAAPHLAFEGHRLVRCQAPAAGDGVHTVELEGGEITVRRGGQAVATWVSDRAWTCAAVQGDRVAAGDTAGRLALWRLHLPGDDGDQG